MKTIQFLLIALIIACFGCNNTTKNTMSDEADMVYSGNMRIDYVGRAAQNEGMHVWGSSPIQDKDGKTHLYAAQWSTATQKNFSGWFKDCEIGHYVGESPEGPFKYLGVAVEDQDSLFNSPHNPTISYIDGKYILCFIVNELSELRTQRIIMYVADDLSDSWRPAAGAESDGTILRKPADTTIWNYQARLGVSNPTLVKHKGKYHLYHKSVIPRKGRGGAYNYGVAISDNLEGPYTIHPDRVTSKELVLEDSYAFSMNDSVFMISRDFGGKLGNTGGGLLWSSADGYYFPEELTKRVYEDLAHYVGEESLEQAVAYRGKKHGHLERAQILTIDDKPAYLYLATGVQTEEGYGSSSHVFKISFE